MRSDASSLPRMISDPQPRQPRNARRRIATILATALLAPLTFVATATPANAANAMIQPRFYPAKSGMYTTQVTCGQTVSYKTDVDSPSGAKVSASITGFGSASSGTFTPNSGGRTAIEFSRSYLSVGTYSPVLTANNETVTWGGSSTPATLSVVRAPVQLTTSVVSTWTPENETYVLKVTRAGDGPSAYPLNLVVEELDGTKLGDLKFAKGQTQANFTLTKFTEDARQIRIRALEENTSCGSGSIERNIPGYIHRVEVKPTFTSAPGLYHNTRATPLATVDLGQPTATGTVTFTSHFGIYTPVVADVVNGKAIMTHLGYAGLYPQSYETYVNYEYSGDKYFLPFKSQSTYLEVRAAKATAKYGGTGTILEASPVATTTYDFDITDEGGNNVIALSGDSFSLVPSGDYGNDKARLSVGYNQNTKRYAISLPQWSISRSEAIRMSVDSTLWQTFELKYNNSLQYSFTPADPADFLIFATPWVRGATNMTVTGPGSPSTTSPAVFQVALSAIEFNPKSFNGAVQLTITDPSGKTLPVIENSEKGTPTPSVSYQPTVPGTYKYSIRYADGRWAESTSAQTGSFEVAVGDTSISAPTEFELSNSGTSKLTASLPGLPADAGASLTATVKLSDRETYTEVLVANEAGEFSLALPQWVSLEAPGFIELNFAGSSVYKPAKKSITLKAPSTAKWSVDLDYESAQSSSQASVVDIHVLAAEGLQNQKVKVYKTGSSQVVAEVTLENGRGQFSSQLLPGPHSLYFDYVLPVSGDVIRSYASIAVEKYGFSVDIASTLKQSRTQQVQFSGRVVAKGGNALVAPTGEVHLTLHDSNGNQVGYFETSALDDEGNFTFTLPPNTGINEYELRAFYSGNNYYQNVSDFVVAKAVPDSTPIQTIVSLPALPSTVEYGKPVNLRVGLNTQGFTGGTTGKVVVRAIGPGFNQVLSDLPVLQAVGQVSKTLPFGTTTIRAEFSPDTPWLAGSVVERSITVTPTTGTLSAPASVTGSVLSSTEVEVALTAPVTAPVSYVYNSVSGQTAALQVPASGELQVVDGLAKLVVPALRPPLATPESVTFSVDPKLGVSVEPVTVAFADSSAKPLSLIAPPLATAGKDIVFSVSFPKMPTDSEDDLIFEVYTGSGANAVVLGSAPSVDGLATISAALPVGSQQVGVRLVKSGETIIDLPRATSVVVTAQKTSISVVSSVQLSRSKNTVISGVVSAEGAPVSGGHVSFASTGLAQEVTGKVQVSSDGSFKVSVPASLASSRASLALNYLGTSIFGSAIQTVALLPDSSLVGSNVSLTVPSRVTAGTSVSLSAKVVSKAGVALSGGRVSFYEVSSTGKRTLVGSVAVNKGSAVLKYVPKQGNRTFVASYSGSGIQAAADSVSRALSVIAPLPQLTKVSVSVSGKANIGSKLKAKVSTNLAATTKFQWYANGKAIRGATKSSYVVTYKNKGKKITVKATSTRGSVKKSSLSKATKAVGRSLMTVSVKAPKSVQLKKTITIKVKVKTPGIKNAKGTVQIKVGKHVVTKKFKKAGTYTFKVPAKKVGKGTKKVTASMKLTKKSLKYSITPKKKSAKVKVR